MKKKKTGKKKGYTSPTSVAGIKVREQMVYDKWNHKTVSEGYGNDSRIDF